MLFATLDPFSRRLRFPRDFEVIITDTVGFIRNLPKDLVTAFSATLDELKNADLLVHVVDASDPVILLVSRRWRRSSATWGFRNTGAHGI